MMTWWFQQIWWFWWLWDTLWFFNFFFEAFSNWRVNLPWPCWTEDLLQNTTADFLSDSRICLNVLTKTARHWVHLHDDHDGRADIDSKHHTIWLIWCHQMRPDTKFIYWVLRYHGAYKDPRLDRSGSGNVTIEEMVTYAYRSEAAWM